MKKATHWIQILIIITIIIFTSNISFGQANNDISDSVVLLLVDRLDLVDIQSMENLTSIIDRGAIGLMNTKANESNNDYASSATIGSGTRTDANHSSSGFVNKDEESEDIFLRRTGFDTKNQEILNTELVELIKINENNSYKPYLGALGDSIHELGMKTAVIGNSDIEDYEVRLGPLVSMDNSGLVDYGDIGTNNISINSNYPFGLKTNYEYLYSKYNELSNQANFIVLELGDLYRLEKYKNNLTSHMYNKHRVEILKDLDLFIKTIYASMDFSNSKLVIVSPFPSDSAYKKGERLTPIIIIDDNTRGILTSDTTRRKGIIANIDIAPCIVNGLNGNIDKFTGKTINTLEMYNNLSFVTELSKDTAFVYNNRINILYTFALFEIIVSIIAFAGIQFYSKFYRYIKAIEFCLLSNMAIPFVILILPLFNIQSLLVTYFSMISLTILITWIAIIIGEKPINSIIFLSGITSLGLIIDILSNSILIKRSFLGYDPIIGARYYGIGNEYMGILVGSLIVFLTAMIDRFNIRKEVIILPMIITVITIGFSKFGANVGGTITSVFAFMFVILKLVYKNLKLKHYGYILLSVFMLLIVLGAIDLLVIKSQSHFANALNRVMNGGVTVIFSIIKRKLIMNFKLLGITIWSKVLILSVVLLCILFYRPFGIAQKMFDRYPNLSVGLLGVLVGSIVGLSVNDSGVVAAATAIIFLAMSLMYLVLYEFKKIK